MVPETLVMVMEAVLVAMTILVEEETLMVMVALVADVVVVGGYGGSGDG